MHPSQDDLRQKRDEWLNGLPSPHLLKLSKSTLTLATAAVLAAASPAAAQFVPGPEYSNQPALATINLLPAYDAGLSGAGVSIGVVDTGMNPDHLEFSGAIVAGYDAMTRKSGTSDFPSFLVDYHGHGSHVASIAAARLDGAVRPDNMQGVAFQAGLVIGAFNFGAEGADEPVLAGALDYVSSQGTRVVNNSWGSDSAGAGDPRAWYDSNLPTSAPIFASIHTALDRGSVMVFAAGNEGRDGKVAINPTLESTIPAYDAAMAAKGGFIVVAATTNDGVSLTTYSNRCGVASSYCIAAPGGGAQALQAGQDLGDQWIVGADAKTPDGYVLMAGTSMATPLVSGAVALVAEHFPWMSNKNLATTILSTGSRAAHPDAEWGRGLLDVGKAIRGPAIFEETFAANVTAGYTSAFGNDISGSAGLSKLGAGSLALNGINTYAGDTVIDGGTLSVNGAIVSNTTVEKGGILGGTGLVANVSVASGGRLAPGNSPGTLTVNGSVVQQAGSAIDIEIDGPGVGNGAGNYDRLVLSGASSTYKAGGSLNAVLRGISAPASNAYSPPLGQGFQFVSAPGGVLGQFEKLTQPAEGLLPGTRIDLVYGTTALRFHVTPASYADIAAAGAASNGNRQQVGAILEGRRPAPGIREADVGIKHLFDSLAAQSARTLPASLDQLGGVGYAQLIGMNLENVKFLVDQTMQAVARQRRCEGTSWRAPDQPGLPGEPQEEVWAQAIGRATKWRGDGLGYTMDDVLGGFMGGFQKRLDARTLAGVSVAYAESSPGIERNMGGGPQQSVQLMGYASRSFADGRYLQGTAGGGSGRIDATRPLAMLDTQYKATIDIVNMAAAMAAGWGTGASDTLRYETSLGLSYLSMRSFGFVDNGNQPLGALRGEPTTNQSLAAAIGGSASLPFVAKGIAWRVSMLANLAHEFADTRTRLDARLLGQSLEVKSAAIGRNRLTLGASLVAQLGRLTRVVLDISNESASNWNATALGVSVRREF